MRILRILGAVSEPLKLFQAEIGRGHGFTWKAFILLTLISLFPASSQINIYLKIISFERLHATLCPFRHCPLGTRVYFKIVFCSWMQAFIFAIVNTILYLLEPVALPGAWASSLVLTLMILSISSGIIVVKMNYNSPPSHL